MKNFVTIIIKFQFNGVEAEAMFSGRNLAEAQLAAAKWLNLFVGIGDYKGDFESEILGEDRQRMEQVCSAAKQNMKMGLMPMKLQLFAAKKEEKHMKVMSAKQATDRYNYEFMLVITHKDSARKNYERKMAEKVKRNRQLSGEDWITKVIRSEITEVKEQILDICKNPSTDIYLYYEQLMLVQEFKEYLKELNYVQKRYKIPQDSEHKEWLYELFLKSWERYHDDPVANKQFSMLLDKIVGEEV